MTRRYHSSVAVATTIPGGTTNVATSIVIAAATGLPASYPYTMIIDDDTTTMEAVEVTNRAGTTLTVTRGVDGTTAQSHATNAPIHHGWSARDLDEPNAWINAGHDHSTTALGGAVPQSSVTGLVSDLAAKMPIDFSAWTATSPSLVNITLGNGTQATYFYNLGGKVIHYQGRITFGSTTTIGANTCGINLPFTAARVGFVGTCVYGDSGTATLSGTCQADTTGRIVFVMANSTANFGLIGTANPFTWTTNDTIDFNIIFEAA